MFLFFVATVALLLGFLIYSSTQSVLFPFDENENYGDPLRVPPHPEFEFANQ
jgi:hypothetical protein